ncbi:MAG: sugar ABC transporter permease [Spirochaetaceae bacterium]|jgi:ABC-type sugar transport system permease subunit|nr:sugar ABC transporter permease [Spirochaetaceae bacterium]
MEFVAARRKVNILPYLLILPAFVLILIFKAYPIFSTIIDGFRSRNAWTLSVYQRVFTDSAFWNALWITIKINLVMIPFQVFISFLLALLVNVTVKGIGIFRTIYYLPVTISLTVATILWNMMVSPNSGVINSLLGIVHIPPQGFLIDKDQALWTIVVIASWKGCGYWMMFLLAGLKNIDPSIYESARIDGANFVKIILRITLPMIRKVLLFVFVANTTANVLLFVPMQMITMGGPDGSTNVLMYEAYKSAFKFADRPRSAVMVTVLLLIIIIICIGQFKLLNEKDDAATGRL